MADHKNTIITLGDVLELVEAADLPPYQRRDLKSAIVRIAEMAGTVPAKVAADVMALRATLAAIRPAAHGITSKTWANLRSRFRAALAARRHHRSPGARLRHADPGLGTLSSKQLPTTRRLSCGLASFANCCAAQGIAPEQVDDAVVQTFRTWLESKTLCPRPRDVVRRVPNLWNEAGEKIEVWPSTKLTILSFKSPPKRIQWGDLAESFRRDADAYLAMRANPDLFDERPHAPTRPLAASTLRQQREHVRLAASVLIESGIPVEDIKCLADLLDLNASS